MVSYGQLNFNDYTGREEIGSVLLIIFSIMSLIILLNLLIAILSNTFNMISKQSKLEQAEILYEAYKDKRVDKYYSSMIFLPAPLNILLFPLGPFIFLMKNYEL